MAELVTEGPELVLRLGRWERLGAMHDSIRVPRANVTSVRAVADPWAELRGLRAPGTGIPGVIALGTRRGGFGKDFAAVYGHRPGVVVELDGAEFHRLVVSSDRAQSLARTIQQFIE
ncbi:MAG TPA: hypothetical protein VME70_08250 [Mycobacteriales bacterium]|nr:hypothetical protein [Mycobacteriales bacterium]